MDRKDEHVSLAKGFHKIKENSFDHVRVIHDSLPQSAYHQTSIATELFGQQLTSLTTRDILQQVGFFACVTGYFQNR